MSLAQDIKDFFDLAERLRLRDTPPFDDLMTFFVERSEKTNNDESLYADAYKSGYAAGAAEKVEPMGVEATAEVSQVDHKECENVEPEEMTEAVKLFGENLPLGVSFTERELYSFAGFQMPKNARVVSIWLGKNAKFKKIGEKDGSNLFVRIDPDYK